MRSTVDLHTHSTASDGRYTPQALARRALESGVTILALTDHDTVAGARELSRAVPRGLTFLPGVEVSSRTRSGKCHILGLGCNMDAPAFLSLMDRVAALRRNKLEARIAFLKENGYGIPEAEFDALRAMPSAGKPQIADALVKYGYARDIKSAISDILDRCPPVQNRVGAGEAAAAIHAAGGIAVWAHPMGETGKRALTQAEFDAMLAELLTAGIAGMECWYAKYPVELCQRLEKTALDHGLSVSGGSDCHGRPGTAPVGTLNAGGAEIGPECLTVLAELGIRR